MDDKTTDVPSTASGAEINKNIALTLVIIHSNNITEILRNNVLGKITSQGPCTVRPALFLKFLFHVEQTERYEIDIFFD